MKLFTIETWCVATGMACALALGSATPARAEKPAASVTGEVVDTYCYAAMGAKGTSHKQCGIDCAKKGIPVGLVEKGGGKLYVLLPNKDKGGLPAELISKMGETVTITGQTYAAGGASFLTVESVQ